MPPSPFRFRRAVVIGSSMTGLVSARVLSEHFEQVLLLERDVLPERPEPRRGLPQARHVHVLLETGQQVLEGLFPGLCAELQREGAEVLDMGRDLAWFHFGVWRERYVSGIPMVVCTRSLMDWSVLRRVRALPGVVVRQGCAVEELLVDTSGTRVRGVRVKGPLGEEVLEADLVVDASGRGSHLPHWLETLGYGRPRVEEVGIDLAYTTRLYQRPADPRQAWRMMIQYPRPPTSWRAGFILQVEGGRWMVSLNSYFGERPPTDGASFLEFARSLPRPELHDALRAARPLTEPVTHRVPSSRWLHYERLPRWPEGLVTLGDAVCAFNPIFGQGITVACLGARLLQDCLREQAARSPGVLTGLARRFQRRLPEVLRLPWRLATLTDLQYPRTHGARPPGLGALHWYLGRLMERTSQDAALYHQFSQVLHLRRGLDALLRPSVALPVLGYGLRSLWVPLAQRANVDRFPLPPGGLLTPDTPEALRKVA